MKQGNRNGTQVVRAPPKKKNQPPSKVENKHSTKTKIPTKGGVKIGDYNEDDKWRCKTCKFMNEEHEEICTTCGDPRIGLKT